MKKSQSGKSIFLLFPKFLNMISIFKTMYKSSKAWLIKKSQHLLHCHCIWLLTFIVNIGQGHWGKKVRRCLIILLWYVSKFHTKKIYFSETYMYYIWWWRVGMKFWNWNFSKVWLKHFGFWLSFTSFGY